MYIHINPMLTYSKNTIGEKKKCKNRNVRGFTNTIDEYVSIQSNYYKCITLLYRDA